ncbi:hypothetical protein EJV47_11975 [Hymenobacter gummosus]|uniref:Uncharacterized protein n=1 Tax=Hymenobacter gummosus TaxID=1776032 RepID=A0A3S0HN07_9BACT|nr:hypothetical protein [Hymenobacter gummosus]RTQ49538.1 hypothetical protein EJV47_11975 [Hymenobacter gummosus]
MLREFRLSFQQQMRGGGCVASNTEAEFFVHDPPAPSPDPCYMYSGTLQSVFDLRVVNARNREIHLIAVDKCLYPYGGEETRCDCALVAQDRLYLVEFKKPELEQSADGKQRHANASDCLRQLAASLKDFYERGIVERGSLVIAHACVGYTHPTPYNGANYRTLTAAFDLHTADIPVQIKLIVDNKMVIS